VFIIDSIDLSIVASRKRMKVINIISLGSGAERTEAEEVKNEDRDSDRRKEDQRRDQLLLKIHSD